MTACVNRKHTKRVAAVVTASLVGALSMGAAPAAAVADTGIDMQFATPEGAFEDAEIASIQWNRAGGNTMYDWDGDGVYETVYDENMPVSLSRVDLRMYRVGQLVYLTVIATDNNDDYEVEYFERGDDGYPVGDAITSDITAVGDYVAKITATEDSPYSGGVYYIPFDIEARTIKEVGIDGNASPTYNAENHTFSFKFTDADGNTEPVTEGIDYDVYYVLDGHDATESNAVDVKDVATYRAVVVGKGEWAGTVEVSDPINVKPLDLSTAVVEGVVSSSPTEPDNTFAIYIDGVRYDGDDPIMAELKADIDLTPGSSAAGTVWKDNGEYTYILKAAKSNDKNIKNQGDFKAYKVAYVASFSYDGENWPSTWTTVLTDSDTVWDSHNVTAFAKDGTVDGTSLSYNDGEIEKYRVYNESGVDITSNTTWTKKPGTYTVVYRVDPNTMKANDYEVGGVAVTKVTVYRDAVNADASAAVLFDRNGDGKKEVVSSISAVYDGDPLDIEVAVRDSNGAPVPSREYTVSYYNADGIKVDQIVDAGTYTLKLTSSKYLLSGTTEMTITVAPLDLSDAKVGKLVNKKFDDVHDGIWYLRWNKDGYAITAAATIPGLDLQYRDADGVWQPLPMDIVKVTILNSEGESVKKVTDEGVYTIKFEARNDVAANNHTVPADITVTCIKDGVNADGTNHLVFTDVSYTDYFADAASYVDGKKFMNGYAVTNIFGSYDQLTRGQVACVLYNMAMDSRKVDEDSLHYVEGEGYVTGFSDVDGTMYYAKAIAWANQAGVVHGYTGTDTFRPDAPVTREEFCAMLANYASKYDESYEEGDADSLAKFDDASGVSDWAEKVVAWGVENGIIGNGGFLNAQGQIIRADAACMVYNYANAE